MKRDIGLWIDRKKAVIVSVSADGLDIRRVESGLAGRVGYRGAPRPKTAYSAQYRQGDDQIDNKYLEHLNKYYEKVIAQISGAEGLLIFGPGEAKFEFEKLLIRRKVRCRDVRVEKADKMTERQIAAKVRRYFGETRARS